MVEQPEKPSVPNDDDLRHDDHEFNPQLEPKKSKAWLNLLRESEKAFEDWNSRCDNIDKLFANLQALANTARDKEFQMFWANCEVQKPSIYAKPPIPVVVPKFRDRRPVYQAASEVLERCASVAFDIARIDDLMMLVRDDVALIGRGVAWCRYESKSEAYDSGYTGYEKVCIDFKDRRDFLHSLSRNWREVTWVAAASYLTRPQARKRFKEHSGDAYQNADYKVDRDASEIGGADRRERAKFWEIWDLDTRRVVWVSEGCEDILDEDDPHLSLSNFFPCPKPAYGTLQRGSLVPVPDVLQYKDQLDEVNLLTSRIHALSDALEAKGFYPAGGAEIADAVQAAIATTTPGRLLVPISNWAAFGGSKEVIVWLPIDMIATTITALVALRKQIIDDIYQITGMADIMRGATDPMETLGAQQLKTQYGSVRVRDKQQELARIARDLVEITSEIIVDEFDPVTMIEMSQTQLPTTQMKQQRLQQISEAVGQAQQMMQQMQQMQPPPQQPGAAPQPPGQPQPGAQEAQQLQGQVAMAQAELKRLSEQPTIDQVLHFLKDNTARAFVLDIETDSTIVPDENAEKQRRTEFVGVLAQMLPQLAQMITTEPKTAAFCGELLKFATAPFRAGRSLDGAIDELVEQMKLKGDQPQGEDPTTAANRVTLQVETMKVEQRRESDNNKLALDRERMERDDQNDKLRIRNDRDVEAMKARRGNQQDMAKANREHMQAINDREEHRASMAETAQKIQLNRETATQKSMLANQGAVLKQQDAQRRANERQQAQAFRERQMLMRPPPGSGRPV